DVLDRRLGRRQVLLVVAQVVQRVLETVLDGAERGPVGGHVLDGGVDRRQVDRRAREVEDRRVDGEAGARAEQLDGRRRDGLAVVGAHLEGDRGGAGQERDAVEGRV